MDAWVFVALLLSSFAMLVLLVVLVTCFVVWNRIDGKVKVEQDPELKADYKQIATEGALLLGVLVVMLIFGGLLVYGSIGLLSGQWQGETFDYIVVFVGSPVLAIVAFGLGWLVWLHWTSRAIAANVETTNKLQLYRPVADTERSSRDHP